MRRKWSRSTHSLTVGSRAQNLPHALDRVGEGRSRSLTRRIRWTAALSLLCLCACDVQSDPNQADPGELDLEAYARSVSIAGPELAALLADATVERSADSNLPSEIATQVRRSFKMLRPLDRDEWMDFGQPPKRYRSSLRDHPRVQRFRARVRLPMAEDAGSPIVMHRGEPLAAWDPESQAFPGLAVWFEKGSLQALSEEKPEDVALEFLADPIREFDPYEADRGSEAILRAGREVIGGVSRPSLRLSAPSTLAIPVRDLAAEELQLAVGVVDRGYVLEAGRVVKRSKQSDGVEFRVEITFDGETRTLWSCRLSRQDVGESFVEYRIDLRPFRGRNVVLRLHAEPGPHGDNAFDYAVWSGISLHRTSGEEPSKPHIVLIDLDTLRADRLGIYGYRRQTSPQLDRWAAERAIVFEDTLATSSWTLPSTVSLLTGLAPHQHGVDTHGERLPPQLKTIAQRLREAGYLTLAAVEGSFLGNSFGLDQGFDVHDARRSTTTNEHWTDALRRVRSRQRGRSVFLLLHTYFVHAPYEHDPLFAAAEEYSGWLAGQDIGSDNVILPYLRGELALDAADKAYVNALYDAAIARLDRFLGDFLHRLDTALDGETMMIIITSDHGEEFWEHGMMGHGHSLHNELLRVPFIIDLPGRGAAVSDAPVTLLDIVPTLLEVAGLPPLEGVPGHSLLHPLPAERERVAETYPSPHRAIQAGEWKLILNSGPVAPAKLYFLPDDPLEHDNVAIDNPLVVDTLRARLSEYYRRYPVTDRESTPTELGAEEMKTLRALGYVG